MGVAGQVEAALQMVAAVFAGNDLTVALQQVAAHLASAAARAQLQSPLGSHPGTAVEIGNEACGLCSISSPSESVVLAGTLLIHGGRDCTQPFTLFHVRTTRRSRISGLAEAGALPGGRRRAAARLAAALNSAALCAHDGAAPAAAAMAAAPLSGVPAAARWQRINAQRRKRLLELKCAHWRQATIRTGTSGPFANPASEQLGVVGVQAEARRHVGGGMAGPGPDPAEALRLLLRHDRLADAARLALDFLDAWDYQVPIRMLCCGRQDTASCRAGKAHRASVRCLRSEPVYIPTCPSVGF